MEILIAMGVVGLLAFALSFLFDGHFDVLGDEPVIPTAAFFATVFGFTGALTLLADVNPVLTFTLPAAIAFILAFLFFFSFTALKRHAEKDEAFVASPTSMIGQKARVNYWALPAGQKAGSGEILVTYLGQRRKVSATSVEPLEATQEVMVVSVNEDGSVEVAPLTVK